MPTIKDEDSDRLNQIERTLRRLQDEMEALRDEMRGTAQAATERADAARANVQATKDRAASRDSASGERVQRLTEKDTRQMRDSHGAAGRAKQAQTDADSAQTRADDIRLSSRLLTRRRRP